MRRTKVTSPRVARIAAKTLANPRASKTMKTLAGSDLAQSPGKKRKLAKKG